jgi:transposase InsO family protein
MQLPTEYDGRGKKRPLPAEPTQALPGSPEKVAILEARLARGEHLWHPQDLRDGHSARDGYDVHERLPDIRRGGRTDSRSGVSGARWRRGTENEVKVDGVIDRELGRRPFVAFVYFQKRRIILGRFRSLDAAAETARRARELVAQQESGVCR